MRLMSTLPLNNMKLFTVVLSSGVETILAPDSERAAWQALELSVERNVTLLDVRPCRDDMWN
jgi:hypothetical protein